MCKYKKTVLLAFAILANLCVRAQNAGTNAAGNNNNTGLMRSEGKIYVVMAVAIIILAGLLFYIVRLDRKITKFEKGDSI